MAQFKLIKPKETLKSLELPSLKQDVHQSIEHGFKADDGDSAQRKSGSMETNGQEEEKEVKSI